MVVYETRKESELKDGEHENLSLPPLSITIISLVIRDYVWNILICFVVSVAIFLPSPICIWIENDIWWVAILLFQNLNSFSLNLSTDPAKLYSYDYVHGTLNIM